MRGTETFPTWNTETLATYIHKQGWKNQPKLILGFQSVKCACLEKKWGADSVESHLPWDSVWEGARRETTFGHSEFEVSQGFLQTDTQQGVGEEYLRGTKTDWTSAMRQM